MNSDSSSDDQRAAHSHYDSHDSKSNDQRRNDSSIVLHAFCQASSIWCAIQQYLDDDDKLAVITSAKLLHQHLPQHTTIARTHDCRVLQQQQPQSRLLLTNVRVSSWLQPLQTSVRRLAVHSDQQQLLPIDFQLLLPSLLPQQHSCASRLTHLALEFFTPQHALLLQQMLSLQQLTLWSCQGSALDALAAHASISRLDLTFSTSGDIQSLAALQHLPSLTSLRLHHYNHSAIAAAVAACASLQQLEIDGDFDQPIAWIAACTQLTELRLCSGFNSSISALQHCSQLQQLHLPSSFNRTLDGLERCSLLLLLRLPGRFNCSLQPLAHCHSLTYLHLGTGFREHTLLPLAQLQQLLHLRLDAVAGAVAVNSLSALVHVQHLQWPGNTRALIGMTALTHFECNSNSNNNNALLAQDINALPSLTHVALWIENTTQADTCLPQLLRVTHLELQALPYAAVAAAVARMPSLTHFTLRSKHSHSLAALNNSNTLTHLCLMHALPHEKQEAQQSLAALTRITHFTSYASAVVAGRKQQQHVTAAVMRHMTGLQQVLARSRPLLQAAVEAAAVGPTAYGTGAAAAIATPDVRRMTLKQLAAAHPFCDCAH